ncbi:hypothetical protein, partial [Escherichia coli]|uniref:hypothetical protein n=1 Tax=Escherichia coli TaxID=562 RepID=UPI002B24DB5D
PFSPAVNCRVRINPEGTDKAKSHCFTHLRYPYKRRYFIIGELVLWKISVYGRKDLTYLKTMN